MEDAIGTLLTKLISGGPEAIIAALLLFVVLLLWERKRLLDQLQKRDEKMDKIVEDYYRGNITLSEALNSLKAVLFEIKGKL